MFDISDAVYIRNLPVWHGLSLLAEARDTSKMLNKFPTLVAAVERGFMLIDHVDVMGEASAKLASDETEKWTLLWSNALSMVRVSPVRPNEKAMLFKIKMNFQSYTNNVLKKKLLDVSEDDNARSQVGQE